MTIPVRLRSGEHETKTELQVNVTYPYLQAPLSITGFTMDKSASFCVCWDGPSVDEFGRISRRNIQQHEDKSKLAVIPFRRGIQANQVDVPFAIREAIIAGRFAAVASSNEPMNVAIYDVQTLQRVKTILSGSPLVRMRVENNQLRLEGNSTLDVYNLDTFNRINSSAAQHLSGIHGQVNNAILRDGVLEDGILRKTDGKAPMLLVRPITRETLLRFQRSALRVFSEICV